MPQQRIISAAFPFRIPRSALRILIFAFTPIAFAQTSPPDPAQQLQTDYDNLMIELAAPVVVLDLGPESAAAAAGIRPGDIITHYDNKVVEHETDLADAEAEMIKQRDADAADPNHDPQQDLIMDTRIPLVVRRGAEAVTIKLPRKGLEVSVVAVEAGVPGPRNEPGTMREGLRFDWDRVPLSDAPAGAAVGQSIHLKLRDDTRIVAEQTTGVTHRGAVWTLTQTTTPPHEPEHVTQTVTVTFRTGDGAHENPFTLGHVDVDAGDQTASVDKTGRVISGTQVTAGVAATDGTVLKPATSAAIGPLGSTSLAIPGCCLPVVAAAIAKQPGEVVQFGLVSEVDFKTRLGYALAARGKGPIKGASDAADVGWLVEVTHFGHTTMAFWFDDAGSLKRADFGNGLVGEP
jgi:hypothetical protein